jgi:hypothetical protein
MSISVGHNRSTTCTGCRPNRSGNSAGRPDRRLGIRAVVPAKRPKTTSGNDRNDAPSKLRVCVTPAVDTTMIAVDTITAVAVDTMTAVAVDTRTTVVVDTTIVGGGRNSLSATDAFDAEPC